MLATSYYRILPACSLCVLLFAGGLIARQSAAEQAVAPKDGTDSTAIKKPQEEEPAEAPAEASPRKTLPRPEEKGIAAIGEHVWVNRKKKLVYVDGQVTLRRGVLEMFACPMGTKEHESVVGVYSRSHVLHTALLAIGAKSGKPVKYTQDKYTPPTGDRIYVTVQWLNKQKKLKSAPAQQWVRNVKTKQAMKLHWVFAGSGFWTDEETGKKYYMAEGGDMICVANFSTAMLDVAAESTQANDGLMFESFTENVPALGTPIRLVLSHVDPAKAKSKKKESGKKAKATPAGGKKRE